MEFLNYFLISLISFLGLAAGIALIRIAPEEKKAMSGHFKVLRYSALALILAFSAFFYIANARNLLILLGYAFLVVLTEWKIDDLLKKTMIVYASLGIVFMMSSANRNLYAIISALVFLYGTAAGSLLYNPKENLKTAFCCSGFLILANLLFFL